MDMIYTQPEAKKNYYVSKCCKPVYYDLIDIKITKTTKLNEGYLFAVHINNDTKEFLKNVDDSAIDNLITNNSQWFKNELSKEEIQTLFKSSFCSQNSTMLLYITNNTKIYINNKLSEIPELFLNISKRIINIKIQLIGMFIYSNQTYNKWLMNTIYIYDEDEDILYRESKEEIEKYWKERMDESLILLDTRIQNICNTRDRMNSLYTEILTTKTSVDWENKISELKKLVQNIIF